VSSLRQQRNKKAHETRNPKESEQQIKERKIKLEQEAKNRKSLLIDARVKTKNCIQNS
jgi:hypothetical protein